ncbi:MAG: TetR/AcrR family transcriptional regulator [Candidatus Binatia bacterium]
MGAAAIAESRSERRKRETRERLLDAALRVFTERGYDAATTGEIAAAADLGAGTFYCHFRDKRDVYEALARRAAREMIEAWQSRLRPGMPLGDSMALALELTAAFWSEDRDRARLLLEGGPSFGSAGHLRLVEDVADLIRRMAGQRGRGGPSPEVAATVVIGLGIELGRIIVGGDSRRARETVAGSVELLRRLFTR